MVYRKLHFSFSSDLEAHGTTLIGKIHVKIYKIKFHGSKES